MVVLYRHKVDPEDMKEDAHMAADDDAEDGRVDMKVQPLLRLLM